MGEEKVETKKTTNEITPIEIIDDEPAQKETPVEKEKAVSPKEETEKESTNKTEESPSSSEVAVVEEKKSTRGRKRKESGSSLTSNYVPKLPKYSSPTLNSSAKR